jgi:hypothetical protein
MFIDRLKAVLSQYPSVKTTLDFGEPLHPILDSLDAVAGITTRNKTKCISCTGTGNIGGICEHRRPVGARLALHELKIKFARRNTD